MVLATVADGAHAGSKARDWAKAAWGGVRDHNQATEADRAHDRAEGSVRHVGAWWLASGWRHQSVGIGCRCDKMVNESLSS